MKKVFIFIWIVFGMTIISGCSGAKLMWYTSNGIVTYNRHTGQFEMLWENAGHGQNQNCDSTCNCLKVNEVPKSGQ